jgi:hypothetical protein
MALNCFMEYLGSRFQRRTVGWTVESYDEMI